MHQRRVNVIDKYLTISLPDSYCRELGIVEGDTVYISKDDNKIIVKKGAKYEGIKRD